MPREQFKNSHFRTSSINASVMLALFLIAGCTNAPEAPPAPVQPLAPTASRLVLFRPTAFVSEGRVPIVTINGATTCALKNGNGFATDVAPGPVNLSAATSQGFGGGTFGMSKLSLNAVKGTTYYIEFTPNVGAVFAPSLLMELASGHQTGAFDIALSDQSDLGGIVPFACGR